MSDSSKTTGPTVTFRKAERRKHRMLAFSPELVREAELDSHQFVALRIEGRELRLLPLKRGAAVGLQIYRVAKDGRRPHGCIWVRSDLLPEKDFPVERLPVRFESGWIVVGLPASAASLERKLA